MAVDPQHAGAEQGGGHLKRDPGPRARLIKQIKQLFPGERLFDLVGRRLLELECRRKQDVLEPRPRELTRVQHVSKHGVRVQASATSCEGISSVRLPSGSTAGSMRRT